MSFISENVMKKLFEGFDSIKERKFLYLNDGMGGGILDYSEVRRVICIFLLRIRPFHCFGQCIQRYKGIETRCGGDVFMTEHLLDIG